MRLIKVKLSAIRRFEETDALLVSDRLVAVIGPNESGKSSLLGALDQIDQTDPIPNTMKTRQCPKNPKIEALFSLDPEDHASLSGVPDVEGLEQVWVVRSTNGTHWRLEDRPKRDLTPRRTVREALEARGPDPAVAAAQEASESPLTEDLWDAALSAARSEEDSLKEEERVAFRQLADALESVMEPEREDEDENEPDDSVALDAHHRAAARAALVQRLREVVEAEARPAPAEQAIQILRGLLPTFVEFRDEDRDLQSEYDLEELGDEVPAALSNIASLAELDLSALREAIAGGDHGTVRLLRENANERLDSVFEESYAQSEVSLHLDTDGSLVRLLVRAEGGEDYVEISERSAGFQWFVALMAFLAQRRYEAPIVLIDEIETHLHYAAQADVIDVLGRQTIAQQIIYTTHSAGALPPDLGTGVRAVVPIQGRHRSKIDNAFWTSGPGLTPLLFGIGASTLAFSVPRHLLIAEGASEAILLPTLLREATELAALQYRIAPGIANTPRSELHRLADEAARVAFIVDGDEAGQAHREDLIAAGHDDTSIVSLLAVTGDSVSLEDLVVADAYVAAVNQQGRPFWKGTSLRTQDLPKVGRAKAVENWCKDNGLEVPSKVRVAQNLVEQTWAPMLQERGGGKSTTQVALCSDQGAVWLRLVHEQVMAAMSLQKEVANPLN